MLLAAPRCWLGWPGRYWPARPVGSAILECKSELGFEQYEVRGWTGRHPHTTLTLLARHFLVRLRCHLGRRAAALTLPQARHLLQASLPRRLLDAATALALVRDMQRRNHAAYRAHRHRRLRLLDSS